MDKAIKINAFNPSSACQPIKKHSERVPLGCVFGCEVRPEPDDEARVLRTTKTPRLVPKAKSKTKARQSPSSVDLCLYVLFHRNAFGQIRDLQHTMFFVQACSLSEMIDSFIFMSASSKPISRRSMPGKSVSLRLH